MLTIRTLKIIIFISLAVLTLLACGSNSPESVIQKYVKAGKNADFKTVQECCTKTVAVELEQMASTFDDDINDLKERNAKMSVKVIRTEIDGDIATVYVEENNDGSARSREITLWKENGKWEIADLY